MIVGQGPTALAVGAGGGCLDIFTLICPFSPLVSPLVSLSLGDGPDIQGVSKKRGPFFEIGVIP